MRRAAGLVLVVVAALAVHWRALTVGFLSDEFYLPLLLRPDGVDFAQVARDAVGPWLSIPGSSSYRPGITLHYCVDAWWFGTWAPGFHLSNLLLHALDSALVWALMRLCWPRAGQLAAMLAGLCFAVHPVTPEAVTWISGRVDTTAALPFLLTLVLTARTARTGSVPLQLLATATGLAALLCKESAAPLPLLVPVVDAWARRRAWPRPSAWLSGLVMGAGYALLRWNALGGTGVDRDAQPLAQLVDTLPGKLVALGAPAAWPGAPGWMPWLLVAAFAGLPLCAALTTATARALLLPLLAAAVLLFLPSFPVPIAAGYGGTRVLYLSLVPLAMLWGAALGARGHTSLRTAAAALMVAAGAALCDGRNRVFQRATEMVTLQQEQIAARAGPAQDSGGVFLLELYRETAGVLALRYDNAYLAFRRPFLAQDVPVYIGANMAIERTWTDHGGHADATGFHAALRAGLLVGAFDADLDPRQYVDLRPAARADLALSLDQLVALPAQAEATGQGLKLAPSATWVRIEWQPQALAATGFEAVEVALTDADGAIPLTAAWFPTEFMAAHDVPRPPADPALAPGLLHHFQCPLATLERAGPRRVAIGALGNHSLWTAQVRFRGRTSFALAIAPHAQPLVLESVKLRALLPALEVPLLRAEPWVAGATPPVLPLGAVRGPLRVVLLTPMRVVEQFVDAAGDGLPLEPGLCAYLRLIQRLAPATRIHYVVDQLAAPGASGATLRRSAAGSFVLH